MVGRVLLEFPDGFDRISDVYDSIRKKGAQITLSTVSKVLSKMEEDLIVSKSNNQVRLIQPEKLIENLVSKYQEPIYEERITAKLPEEREEASKILSDYFGNSWIFAGESVADKYSSTPRIFENKVYIKSAGNLSKFKKVYEDKRFFNYNIFLIAPKEDFVFFSSVNNTASRIQAYLELSKLDKREKEIAEDIKRNIINGVR